LRGFIVKYYNKGVMMSEREVRSLARALWGEWASYAAIYFLAGMRATLISL
jgi:3-methyladenine DNA glycosylase/8-oxoguanine DNA glycosylase